MTQPDINQPDSSETVSGSGNPSQGTGRAELWIATMSGQDDGKFTRAHKGEIAYEAFELPNTQAISSGSSVLDLNAKLELEHLVLSPSATFSTPGNFRERKSLPTHKNDPNFPLGGLDLRTRFEHDRDRIKHSDSFRRLAGKTQVHLNPDDHQRTRLTHALEVAQIAVGIAQALRLNVPLTEAIALGHDCGHGPGGHASEDAFDPYLPGGFNHAIFGADVTLRPLNLCFETLDGIRNHSWSLETPLTPEAEVVSFADRIAYVCHDLEDALSCAMIARHMFPVEIAGFMNRPRGEQIDYFIRAVIKGTLDSGTIAMVSEYGELLAEIRKFNNEFIYQHPKSIESNENVIKTLRELVDYLVEHPQALPEKLYSKLGDDEQGKVKEVVTYVAGMTDDFAYRLHSQFVENTPVVETSALYLM